jgi:hypothetical protein
VLCSEEGDARSDLTTVAPLRHLNSDILVIRKTCQAGLLDCRDVHEHIVAAALWGDETIAIYRSKSLHGSRGIVLVPHCSK